MFQFGSLISSTFVDASQLQQAWLAEKDPYESQYPEKGYGVRLPVGGCFLPVLHHRAGLMTIF